MNFHTTLGVTLLLLLFCLLTVKTSNTEAATKQKLITKSGENDAETTKESVKMDATQSLTKADDASVKMEISEESSSLVGLRNDNNYCYMISVLQMLYHLISVRRYFVQNESNNILHLSIASLFSRMANNHMAVQTLNAEFMLIVKGLASNSGATFRAGEQNDVSEFWQWLMTNMKTINRKFFEIETRIWHEIDGILMVEKSSKSNRVIVQVLKNPKVSIDALLEGEEKVDFILNSNELKHKFALNDMEKKKNLWEIFKEKKCADKAVVKATQFTEITKLPPILVIQAPKFEYKKEETGELEAIWRNDVETLYSPSFTIKGRKYTLYGTINHRSLGIDHYVCRVCVDPNTDKWATFDDSIASVVDRAKPYVEKESPYWFFYVNEETLNNWKKNPEVKVAEQIGVLSQIFESAEFGLSLISALTGKKSASKPLKVMPIPKEELFRSLG